ncbi:MAG: TonB-dependent receptor, partial [Bryobacteraceae bacterium]
LSNMAGQPRLDFAYERGGFNVNAPIWIPKIYNGRNRTFFSYSYEVMNDYSQGYPLLTSVPPLNQRGGDFSALLKLGPQYQIYDPATTTAAGGGRFSRVPFPGNIVPASRIDPVAQKILNYWPKPNVAGLPDGSNNYSVSTPDPNFYQNNLLRIDHSISDKQRIYGHYTQYFKNEGPYRDYFLNDSTGQLVVIQPLNLAFDDTYVVSPRLVVDVRYGLQRFPINSHPKSQGFDLSTLGFPQALVNQVAYRNPLAVAFPRVDVAGIQSLNGENPSFTGDDIHSLFADVNRPVGNHALKFGGEGRIYRKNTYTYTDGTPHFIFGTPYTSGPLDNSASSPGGVGQGLAAFLLGQPSSGDIAINDSYALKSTEYGAYIQDDWRATPKLTVTLGLRYEYNGALTERYNRTARGFDPGAVLAISSQVQSNYAANPIPEIPISQFQTKGGLVFAGVGGQPRTLYAAGSGNFMPRVGFSYNPFKNTVVRGGYGIYYLDNGIVSRVGPYQLGYSQTTNLIPTIDNGLTFTANLQNPFPGGVIPPTGNRSGPMTNVGQAISFFDTSVKTPYMQRWNWTMQQLLPGNISLQVGYAGSRSTRLRIPKNYDGLPDRYLSTRPVRDQAVIDRLSQQVTNPFYPLLPGTGLAAQTVSVAQLLLPFPQFTNMTSTTSQGYSWYHSVQALVERRFANGFSFQISYTFSKQMDAINYLNPADPLPYRSISANDRPHHVGLAAIYELPFGKGRALLSGAPTPVRRIVSGWQLGTVINSWSGSPLSFGDIIFNGDIKNIALPGGQRTVQRWFNTNAGFVTAPGQQLVNHLFAGPLYYSGIRSGSINTTDISVLRYISLRENIRLQIRAEALNAFNHPNFAPPNTTVTSSAFGTINTEATFTRIIQFGVKLLF